MSKQKILIQLDPDPQASTFDSVVAIDSGVEHLIAHGNVSLNQVEGLVHGAMFTRGPHDLRNTALFVGGSDVVAAEAIVQRALSCFFGPLRVSLMSDPNGANTTAAAAVLCAEQHLDWSGKTIAILAGTGPVGQRIAHIIAHQAAGIANPPTIRVCSRQLAKASQVCQTLALATRTEFFVPRQTENETAALAAIEHADAIFATGAAGISLLPMDWLSRGNVPAIAIDLNAVPPAGIPGIDVLDRGTQQGSTIFYGAIGVGGLKMKIHKKCLASLFEANDRVLQTNEIYEVGKQL